MPIRARPKGVKFQRLNRNCRRESVLDRSQARLKREDDNCLRAS
jgi:hypothetical protein